MANSLRCSSILFFRMGRLNRKPSPAVSGSKDIKRVVSGKLQGTWDMANRYFLIEVPSGIADTYMKVKGIDGIHLLRFSAFECAGYQVGWVADYPIDCEDYLIEREFRKLKRCCPDTETYLFSACMASQTSTVWCAQPTLLVVQSL